jgi:ribosome modulation factor
MAGGPPPPRHPPRRARLPPAPAPRAGAEAPAPLARHLAGIGLLAVGLHRQGWDLQLTQYGDGHWRATYYVTGQAHSIVGGSPGSRRRDAGSAPGGVAGDEQGIITVSDQQCPWMTNRGRVPHLSGWRESTRVLTTNDDLCIGIAEAHQAVFR